MFQTVPGFYLWNEFAHCFKTVSKGNIPAAAKSQTISENPISNNQFLKDVVICWINDPWGKEQILRTEALMLYDAADHEERLHCGVCGQACAF